MDVRDGVVGDDAVLPIGERGEHLVAGVAVVAPDELFRQLSVVVRHESLASSSVTAMALRPRATQVATVPSGTSSRRAIS